MAISFPGPEQAVPTNLFIEDGEADPACAGGARTMSVEGAAKEPDQPSDLRNC